MEKEKKKIKVSAIQMESVIADKKANFKKIEKLIAENIQPDTDILILPELWNVGWACNKFVDAAEEIKNSPTITLLSNIAQSYKINILGGSFVLKENDKLYNTCPVINREGNIIAQYRKNHLYSYYDDSEGSYITRGDNPVMVNIEGIKYGLTICYDIRFPEIYRAYRKAGADILVNMAAWPLSRAIHWDSLTQARSVENQTYMVALTQTGTLPTGAKNLGHSLIYDYSGNIIDEIDTQEGIITAVLDIEAMYEFRDKCTVLKDIQESYEVVSK